MGTGQLSSILIQGFKGPVYPIHPSEAEVLKLTAYPTIADVPETPDLVVLVLPTDVVPGILEECGRAGVPAAIVVSGGFKEAGGPGAEKERLLAEIAGRYDMTLIGPNAIGVSNFHIGLDTTYFPYRYKPGGVTVVSQSGTYSCQIYDYAGRLGVGLSHTVSVGNSAATDLSDCLEYFADEPTTRSIALYIEGVSDGEKFMKAARYAVGRKPVAAIYVGGTGAGAQAGMSHTGALAGEDDVYDGMLRQAGILRAYSIEELLDWSWALANQPVPPGNRMCVLSNSGGPGASMADCCVRAGLEVPRLSETLQAELRGYLPHTASTLNPVDMTFTMDFEVLHRKVPQAILASGEVDGIVEYNTFGPYLFRVIQEELGDRVQFPIDDTTPVIVSILESFKDLPREYGRPIAASSFWGREDEAITYLTDNGIPMYPTPERAVGAMAALYHRRRVLDSLSLTT